MKKLPKLERKELVDTIAFYAEEVNGFPSKEYHKKNWRKQTDDNLLIIYDKWFKLYQEKRAE